MKENVGFRFTTFPSTFGLGFNVDWSGIWKKNYLPGSPNVKRAWVCINFVCWQISFSCVWKTYYIKEVK